MRMHKYILLVLVTALSVGCKRGKAGSAVATTKGGLTPETLDESKVVAVADLKQAYFAWNGKMVSVYGYPSYMVDKGVIQKEISLTPAPFARWVLSCELAAPITETAGMRDKPMVLKGVVKESPYDTVALGSCQLVSSGETTTVAAQIANSPEQVMNAAEFVKAYNAWKGKKVTVSGNYHSTTTSTNAYGKTIRVDLTDAAGNKCVGAEFAVDPSDKLAGNRDNVQMKCEIKGTTFDMVNLTNCALLNP